MEFQAKVANILTLRSAVAVVGVYQKEQFTTAAALVNEAASGLIASLIRQGDFKGDAGQTLMLHQVAGTKAERVLLLGLGQPETPMTPEQFLKIVGKAAGAIKASPAKDVSLYLDEVEVKDRDSQWKATQVARLVAEATYTFTQLKSKKATPPAVSKGLYALAARKSLAAAETGVATGVALATGMALCKDLGNLPGNICTPTYLAAEARKLARGQAKLSCKVLGEKEMKELGMHSLLSVAAGSDQPAQLIVLDYKGGKRGEQPVVLVGKGITFDTGGISLKPGAGMDEMKYDMGGAASVLGTVKTLLSLDAPVNVVAIVAAAENMPGGGATKPGDIVTSMSGQTIEILNTDAEGRLILCDALTYAQRFKPAAVVDVATLTGACVIALGHVRTGLFTADEALAQSLAAAGQAALDPCWRMPLDDEYGEGLKSNFADMANVAGRAGGSASAAKFLQKFVGQMPWAHLDIAGTAWKSGAAKGATGRPVGLLVQFVLDQAKRQHAAVPAPKSRRKA